MSLTKHPQGSIKELLTIALPLMLSSLSVVTMFFVDRMLLANYSLAAFNAAVTASTLGWAFLFGAMTIATIAEVFVAQYNGAKEYSKLGGPVWQMIWFGVMTSALFIPLSIWGPEFFWGAGADRGYEREYFTWMVLFGPSYAIYGALAAFFIGQGKTGLVSLLALGANFVNLLADVVMIFGIEGYFPSLGVKGAAIATSMSNLFQAGVLFYLFMKKENRLTFGTGNYRFDIKQYFQCLKVGVPGGLSAIVEISGWAAFYEMMALVGTDYITVAGLFQSFLIPLFFVPEGLSKALVAISGNLIGSSQSFLIPKAVKSGIAVMCLFMCTLLAGYPFFVDMVISLFSLDAIDPALYQPIRLTLLITLFYIFFDGVRFVLTGVLTAAGDTFFLLAANFVGIWLLLIIPTYVLVVVGHATVLQSILIAGGFSLAMLGVFYTRYALGRWKKLALI